MQTFSQSRNHLYFADGRLSHLVIDFFEKWCRKTIYAMNQYFDAQPEYAKEHAFEYREQQIKTFLTVSLAKLTGNNLLQEYPIDRIFSSSRKKNEYKRGFLDYWAADQFNTYLIEVKKHGVRFDGEKNTFSFYADGKQLFADAQQQLDVIPDKPSWSHHSSLYTLALLVTPVWTRGEKCLRMRVDESLEDHLKEGIRNYQANLLYWWSFSRSRIQGVELENGNEKEYYPGIIFWGKLRNSSNY
jgi:hypothetical protein